MGDYIKIYTPAKAYIVHITLKGFEENVPPGKFMRVHRSYIVALNKIESIDNDGLNILNTPIPVAESYRSQLIRKIKLLETSRSNSTDSNISKKINYERT